MVVRGGGRRALGVLGALVLGLTLVGPLRVVGSTAPAAAAVTPGLVPVGQGVADYTSFFPGIGPRSAFSSPAVGDITGSGVPEVVVGSMDGCVRVFSLTGVNRIGCLTVGPFAVQSSPTLVDWNGDGIKDIIVSSTGGGIFGWKGDGTPLFHFATAGAVFATPAVGDLDGDGLPDIVVSTWGQQVTAYRHDGSVLFSRFIFDTSWSSPALADLNGDGRLDVIVGGDMDIGNAANGPPWNLPPGGYIWAFRGDGSDLPGFPRHLSNEVIWSSPAIADLDGDGFPDIVVGTGENFGGGRGKQLFAIDRFGNALPGWPVAMPGATMGSPAIADLDGDGRLDVVAQSGDGSISYINRDGGVWKQWCNRSFGPCQQLAFDGGPSVGDINGDGVLDVVAFTEAHLRVFNGVTGALEYENALPLTWVPGSHPTIVSYAGDTYVVVTATVNTNGDGAQGVGDRQITSIFRSGRAPGQLPWPMFRNNLKRTGTVDDSVPPTVSGAFTTSIAGSTKLRVDASGLDRETGVRSFDIDVQTDSAPWVRFLDRGGPVGAPGATVTTGRDVYAIPGHSYTARVRGWDRAGNVSAWNALGTIVVPVSAPRVQPFRSAYASSVFGSVSSVSSPPVDGPSFPGGLGRGVAAAPLGGGDVLDAFGGVHPFGGAPGAGATAYWPGWDIARGIALDPGGVGGLVLDGFGGVHPFGGAQAPNPLPPYWPGWDIARGIVLTADSTLAQPRGYLLDGFGGVHPFGGAPPVAIGGYWPGWQIVRGFALDPAGPGGYVLDAFGAIHPFGGAPARSTGAYWVGQDVARGVALVGGGAAGRGYVLDGAGAVWPFGGAPAVDVATYWGAIVAGGLSIAP